MSPLCFDNWMRAVDEICYTELGCSYSDLPDMPYLDWYQDGYSPEDAFQELTETAYPGVDFDTGEGLPFSTFYYSEIDEHTDADPGL